MSYFSPDYLAFFKELAANNNKEWFDINRKRYETSVKKPFYAFVEVLIAHFAKEIPDFKELKASDCVFRINRDIRFSSDKTPYKTFLSAVIAPQGKKSKSIHGVYFELSPEHVRVYGGIYEIDKDDLYAVREGIVNNLEEFKSLYSAKGFKTTFNEILGAKNKVLPKEFKVAAEQEPLLFNKQFYFYAQFDPELVEKAELLETIITCFKAGEPIELFFNKFIDRP